MLSEALLEENTSQQKDAQRLTFRGKTLQLRNQTSEMWCSPGLRRVLAVLRHFSFYLQNQTSMNQ